MSTGAPSPSFSASVSQLPDQQVDVAADDGLLRAHEQRARVSPQRVEEEVVDDIADDIDGELFGGGALAFI